MKLGAKVTVETPGAGGYGKPEDRAPEAAAKDGQSGKYAADFITKHYSNVTGAEE